MSSLSIYGTQQTKPLMARELQSSSFCRKLVCLDPNLSLLAVKIPYRFKITAPAGTDDVSFTFSFDVATATGEDRSW